MIAIQDASRRYGTYPGAAGISVIERSGTNVLADPRFGTVAFYGILKRGPMGVSIPLSSRRLYDEIYGDPKDSTWHLFPNSAQLLPDAIDGYFATGGGSGMVWLTRLDLNGKARKAEMTLQNRFGADVLKITAANEGRWGGVENEIPLTPVVYATSRTFTLYAPDVLANEFAGATVEFSAVPGKRYQIIANTTAFKTGEVVFTVGSQYSLVRDGVSGPAATSGLSSFAKYLDLTGTVSFAQYQNIAGAVTINQLVVTGVGTTFTTSLEEGSNIYYNGEARVVTSITSDTTLTISDLFTTEGSNLSIQKDNLELVGTGTLFATELVVGGRVYLSINDQLVSRTIAEIASNLTLTLTSGFPSAVGPVDIAKKDNYEVTGVDTKFLTEVSPGQYLVDPYRQGESIKVISVVSDTSLTVEKQFSNNFNQSQLTKQSQKALVYLTPANKSDGLTVEVKQGIRYPQTHFSLLVKFNGSSVLSISDASLDPNDPLYVEPLVNDNNIAYRTGSNNYQKWITAENLWDSAYTTGSQDDVRPCNSSGIALVVQPDKIYTAANIDYVNILNNLLYSNPYVQARNFYRIKKAIAPVSISGTISSTGSTVNGTATAFVLELNVGDYIYDPVTNVARKIRSIQSNTILLLDSAFTRNIPPLTKTKKLGYLQIDPSYDLTFSTQSGSTFFVPYPQNLTKGYDDDTSNILSYHFTKFADVDRNHLENATFGKDMGLIRIACPGISDIAIQKAFAFYAQEKGYEFRGEIPSSYTTAAAAEAFVNNELGRNDFITLAFPSYGYIANPFAAGDRMVPISGEIMGGESKKAVVAEGYHVPFAGVTAILSRIIKLPFEIMPSEEAVINIAGIQPIKSMYGNIVVFGGRVPSVSTLYDFIHIRRIQTNFVRQFLEARTALEVLFLPNQPIVLEQIIMTLNNFASREYRKGVFTKYLNFEQAVQITGGDLASGINVVNNNSGKDAIVAVINGKLSIYFQYTPTGIVEQLSINCGPDVLVSQYGSSLSSSF